MTRKRNIKPIFYNDEKEMDKPLSELIEDIRNDLSKIRGKIYDIRTIYGREDQLEHLEGGLSCIIVAASYTVDDLKKIEKT